MTSASNGASIMHSQGHDLPLDTLLHMHEAAIVSASHVATWCSVTGGVTNTFCIPFRGHLSSDEQCCCWPVKFKPDGDAAVPLGSSQGFRLNWEIQRLDFHTTAVHLTTCKTEPCRLESAWPMV
jgi:hypothetical protein